MNPSLPIQRPPTDPPASDQWAALNTNLELQRTLCKAAASGQLTQDQMMSFTNYMRGNPTTLKMFQAEVQAHQQHQIAQQQQQQQQLQQLKRQQQQHQHQHQHQQHSEHLHPTSQAQLPMTSSMPHYQQPNGPSPQPAIRQRPPDPSTATHDPTLIQLLTQLRQVTDEWKNPNLIPAEKEAIGQRASKLHDLIRARMSQLGVRNVASANSPNPAPPGSSPHNNTQPTAQSSLPPHPNEVQQAQLSAVYQRKQQMMSSMQYASQANVNISRPLANNLLAATSSPRQTLNISGRISPAPNISNSQPLIPRPGSSHQPTTGGPASSPPAMFNVATTPPNSSTTNLDQKHAISRPPPKSATQSIGMSNSNAASPVNLATSPRQVVTSLAHPHQTNNQISSSSLAQNATRGSPRPALRPSLSPAPPPNERSLSPNPVSNQTPTPEPTAANAPQPHQNQASAGNLQAKAPASVLNLASQQHTAIAAQQAGAQHPAPSTGGTRTTSNQTAQPTTREPTKTHPTPPVPVAFPPPRPTLTGGHVTPSTLAGSFLHQPPTHGVNQALGHSNSGRESSSSAARGPDATSANRIISKRKIQELVESIDPSERLETEVEDLLLELADEFIDSVTRFSCQLAKHRKSDRLETKDIQLHLERSWNIRIPGFANDEIRQSQSRKINALPSYLSRVAIVRDAFRNKKRS